MLPKSAPADIYRIRDTGCFLRVLCIFHGTIITLPSKQLLLIFEKTRHIVTLSMK